MKQNELSLKQSMIAFAAIIIIFLTIAHLDYLQL